MTQKLTLNEAFDKFKNYVNFVKPISLIDLISLHTSMIDPVCYGKKEIFDEVQRIVKPGDLVSFCVKKHGHCYGILMGTTTCGYRVLRIKSCYDAQNQQRYFDAREVCTPFEIMLCEQNIENKDK